MSITLNRWNLSLAFVLAAACVIGGISCKAPTSRSAESATNELPALGAVPTFKLTDQRGASLTNTDLLGAPWVANTFFTTCRTICPGLMRKVRDLHAATAGSEPSVRFVSITVDPDNDTPEALAKYQKSLEVSPRWSLLTGDFDAIRHLVVEGFHTAMGKRRPDITGDQDITHSGKLFLVDAEGQIRGYFSADKAGVVEAKKALESLAK